MKRILSISIFLLLSLVVYSQQKEKSDEIPPVKNAPWGHYDKNPHKPFFSPWEYMKKEDEFIVSAARLTSAEAQSVCPLLHKMKEEKRKLDMQIHRLLQQAGGEEPSESGSRAILKQINNLEKEKVEVASEYRKQMLRCISAKKMLQVMKADIRFERSMLRDMFLRKHQHHNKKKQ